MGEITLEHVMLTRYMDILPRAMAGWARLATTMEEFHLMSILNHTRPLCTKRISLRLESSRCKAISLPCRWWCPLV